MRCSQRNRALCGLLALVVLAGCADTLSRRDSITLGVGNAPEANTAIQTIEPWPADVEDTNIVL